MSTLNFLEEAANILMIGKNGLKTTKDTCCLWRF